LLKATFFISTFFISRRNKKPFLLGQGKHNKVKIKGITKKYKGDLNGLQ